MLSNKYFIYVSKNKSGEKVYSKSYKTIFTADLVATGFVKICTDSSTPFCLGPES